MDIVRTATADTAAKLEPLKLSVAQQKAQNDMADLEKAATVYEQASVEAAGLQAKSSRTPEEETQLKQLSANMEQESAAILSSFTGTIDSDLAQRADAQAVRASDADRSAPSYLQGTLEKLGPHVLGIRLRWAKITPMRLWSRQARERSSSCRPLPPNCEVRRLRYSRFCVHAIPIPGQSWRNCMPWLWRQSKMS